MPRHSNPRPNSPSDHHRLASELRATRADSLIHPPPGLIASTVSQLPERKTRKAAGAEPSFALSRKLLSRSHGRRCLSQSSSEGGGGSFRARTTPLTRATTAHLLLAAAAVAFTAIAWFYIPSAPRPTASEALSQSLNILPNSNLAQLLLDPARRETQSLVSHTRRATDALRFSLPLTRLP